MRMAAMPQQAGCPTLAASLFLPLGWDSTTLDLPFSTQHTSGVPHPCHNLSVARVGNHEPSSSLEPGSALSAGLVHFFESCGVMKAAVDAELRAVGR